MINQLRNGCQGEVFSYTYLMDQLQSYVNPRGKVSRMLKAGQIIRVKKRLYVFGKMTSRMPINRKVLANLIYGPSYVSGHYALAHHQLIPERVKMVTNMTTKKNKSFDTPFGIFKYVYLHPERYRVGVDWHVNDHECYLMASPEKALAGVIVRQLDLGKESQLLEWMIDDMRMDTDRLADLSLTRMAQVSAAYRSPVVHLLYQTLASRVL
jgi:hypothetical protein